MSDRVLYGGPNFAESGVELDLAGIEVTTGRSFERHGVDAVGADVVQIGDGRTVGEKVGQTRRGEGVASCRAPCTEIGPTAARQPPSVAAIWRVIPAYPACRIQVRDVLAIPAEQIVPPIRAVPLPMIYSGRGTRGARTCSITGRSRSIVSHGGPTDAEDHSGELLGHGSS